MPVPELLVAFAAAVRADRAANPGIAGDGTALELLIAPRFQILVETAFQEMGVVPPAVLPEYKLGGVGRPDLALARAGQPARAFIELKEPRKLLSPDSWRGHDADQFRRFSELPLWALCNFASLRLYQRAELVDETEIMPAAALDPATPAARAERLIRAQAPRGFERILRALAMAEAPAPKDAQAIAQTLAHAARLVREIVAAQCAEGLHGVIGDVRAEFNETLFARPEAGGYDTAGSDALFASAFAQTLIFGLLFAREAGGGGNDGHGGSAAHLPIYLADTLAPPAGAAGVATHLAFMGAPMVAERQAADTVKQTTPILAIFGNPPYRRLRRGEVERLVGADMARRWRDLTQPVRDAGFGRSLNAFPDPLHCILPVGAVAPFRGRGRVRTGGVGLHNQSRLSDGPRLRRASPDAAPALRCDTRARPPGRQPRDPTRDGRA
jgi:hypothetical protein